MTKDRKEFQGTPCLNCGAPLAGNYCAECGQPATDVNLSVKSLVVEFAESLFSLETGFWQTFRRLVFQPGSLTSEYVAGRRKRYSSPIKLYLGTSLVFFFLIGFFGGDGGDAIKVGARDESGEQVELTGAEAIAELRDGFADASADSALNEAFGELRGEEQISNLLQNPDAAKARFFSYLPRAMFLMVPLCALLFRIVYVRHDRPYLHYLVFALHLHALFYLTASVAGMLGRIPPEWLGDGLAILVFLTFPVGTIRAQRRTFGDGWGKAFLKAALVWHLYGLLVIVAIVGVLVLTVFQA